MGDMTGTKSASVPTAGAVGRDLSLNGFLDALYFVAILVFTAFAVLAVALAAPLAIIATALAGAVSALTAGRAKRSGWRVAGA